MIPKMARGKRERTRGPRPPCVRVYTCKFTITEWSDARIIAGIIKRVIEAGCNQVGLAIPFIPNWLIGLFVLDSSHSIVVSLDW